MKNKDLYVIELKNKIKVGITHEFNKRIKNIKTSAGIKDNEIIEVFHYPDLAILEARLKFFFKKQKIAGEWFYKVDLVLEFINELKKGSTPTIELLNDIKNNNVTYSKVYKKYDWLYGSFEIQKENAINLLEKIKNERKGIGFPNSIDLTKFIRLRKAGYRNMRYLADDDFQSFQRVPNFSLENISNSQVIECLKIIKNTTPNNVYKKTLQDYIDSIFAKNFKYYEKILRLIGYEFFGYEEVKKISIISENENINYQNIKLEYDKLFDIYSFKESFENLSLNEKVFLKNGQNSNLDIGLFGRISFDFKERFCFCHFEVENYLQVLNFFSTPKLDENNLRFFFNDTNKVMTHYIFQFKYHLLNKEENKLIKNMNIEDVSHWYLKLRKDNISYYCIYDNFDDISMDLGIDKREYEHENDIISVKFESNNYQMA